MSVLQPAARLGLPISTALQAWQHEQAVTNGLIIWHKTTGVEFSPYSVHFFIYFILSFVITFLFPVYFSFNYAVLYFILSLCPVCFFLIFLHSWLHKLSLVFSNPASDHPSCLSSILSSVV